MATYFASMKKTDEFSSVFSFKKRVSARFLVVHYQPEAQPTAKIGLAVAKRIAPLAVERNYMRRVLRELCRQAVLPETCMVIQAHQKFGRSDFSTIKAELPALFAKIAHRLSAEQMDA